jgi:hypothetical protein
MAHTSPHSRQCVDLADTGTLRKHLVHESLEGFRPHSKGFIGEGLCHMGPIFPEEGADGIDAITVALKRNSQN